MEEDECDYRTPIGKVIKQINYLCKKPPLDNQLSEAIDLFHEKLDEQEKYLANGIFRVNFTESALFLQCCSELYGKKVDLLWKELLELHTRLIRYDYEHQKENGDPINKEDIDKLEERRNRYLRKKKFKLLQQEEQQQQPSPAQTANKIEEEYLLDEDVRLTETEEFLTLDEVDKKLINKWTEIDQETKERLKIPYVVHQQMTRTYRLKNYPILKFEDFEILDIEDEEFSTRYSRVPGWNHILHLLEYNEYGLLPDSNNLLARLKLMVRGKLQFMLTNNIPFDTPFEKYKCKYIEYCNRFFKEEAKKWQNMPLNTFEDFRKQLQFLSDMHTKNEKIARSTLKNGNQNDKIEIILDNSDEDSLFELTFNCNKEYMQSDLFVRLEKLSSEIINTKLRQDSGFYDDNGNGDNENIDTGEDEISNNDVAHTDINEEGNRNSEENNSSSAINDVNTAETANNEDDGSNVNDVNTTETVEKEDNNGNSINEINATKTANNEDNGSDVNEINTTTTAINEDEDNNSSYKVDTTETANNEDDDNFETRSFISDHDYCVMAPVASALSNLDTDLAKDKDVLEETVETTFKKPLGSTKIIPKIAKIKEPKKHHINRETENESSPKRRKLSQKQIEALLKSKVTPVKVLKFEKFFSENYQPEDGEGEITSVEYNSDDSDTEGPLLETATCVNNWDDQEDTRSIYSDHSYCQPLPEDARNDSGFLELFSQKTNSDQIEKENPSVDDAGISLEDGRNESTPLINDSQIQSRTLNGSPLAVPIQQDNREIERKKLHARVEEWRNTINPILKNLKEQDFDIHEYGSQIIEGMEINDSKPFSSIVGGKASAEVVRYFISSLQLANTNNIEICGVKPGHLSNDTFNVKLLSKERFHEHLSEYLAPSEETLAEKLEKIRAVNAQQEKSAAPKTKQQKTIEKTYKGKKLPSDMKMFVKIVKLSSNASIPKDGRTEEMPNADQHNKGNCSVLPSPLPEKSAKGKNIIKRQTQQVLNFDMSLPSTSRQTHWSETLSQASVFDPQMPSTSSQNINSELFDSDQRRSPNLCNMSPNKRRRSESSEETFLERLVSTQRINPDIQVHSTPNGPPAPKHLKVSSCSKKSILF